MGKFVDSDNGAFKMAVNSEIYVDKTGIIEYTNKVISTNRAFICNSRPRRFGKSITADMLTAYYSKGCDSVGLFSDFEIAGKDTFRKHLNKYHVIHFDVQWCMNDAGSAEKTVAYINKNVISELAKTFSNIDISGEKNIFGALAAINAVTETRFVIIIDEWDVLIREEAHNISVQEEYINFLRGMFKGTEPMKYVALAYLTGILPIKKIRTQSALNNFDEFTMTDARVFAPYIGFTEKEVKDLCLKYDRDFEKVKKWYDGYIIEGYHIYNPKAVVSVLLWGKYQSYWSQTGTYDSVVPLINMDFDGLKTKIIEMIAGLPANVSVYNFQNDMVSFSDCDDVLTLLIHLGYLAYDSQNEKVFIPNEEIRREFMKAVKKTKWNEMLQFQRESEELLEATLNGDPEAVAAGIERMHMEYASNISYNNENSLSSVLTIAYLSSMQYYFKPVCELPAGRGFADFVYLPKMQYANDYPALIVELKWDKSAHAAIDQIKEKKYPEALSEFTGNVMLVGINYDKSTKEHSCIIETLKFN